MISILAPHFIQLRYGRDLRASFCDCDVAFCYAHRTQLLHKKVGKSHQLVGFGKAKTPLKLLVLILTKEYAGSMYGSRFS